MSPNVVPVTHVLYVGLAVFVIGLACLLLRRDLVRALLGLGLGAVGTALVAVGFSRWWGNADGQALAVVVIAVSGLQILAGGALVVGLFAGKARPELDSQEALRD